MKKAVTIILAFALIVSCVPIAGAVKPADFQMSFDSGDNIVVTGMTEPRARVAFLVTPPASASVDIKPICYMDAVLTDVSGGYTFNLPLTYFNAKPEGEYRLTVSVNGVTIGGQNLKIFHNRTEDGKIYFDKTHLVGGETLTVYGVFANSGSVPIQPALDVFVALYTPENELFSVVMGAFSGSVPQGGATLKGPSMVLPGEVSAGWTAKAFVWMQNTLMPFKPATLLTTTVPKPTPEPTPEPTPTPTPEPALLYDIHVSPGGDDLNAGTSQAPFKTIERARQYIRANR